ncbi:MAG: hypothetical protein ACOC93_05295, partial [Planctomycetota bacterium]
MSEPARAHPANLLYAFHDGAGLDTFAGPVRIQVCRVADLVLPTGSIVAADAGDPGADVRPFAEILSPGCCAVE